MTALPTSLLAIEAATNGLSVALFRSGVCLGVARSEETKKPHSETLLPAIARLLEQAEFSLGQVEAFGVTRGPGSFTSLRIALATALGLAFPQGKPVYALSTLETLAFAACSEAQEGQLILALLDARKGETYGALYRARGETRTPELVLAPDVCLADEWLLRAQLELREGETLCLAGSGARAYENALRAASGREFTLFGPAYDLPQADALGRLILAHLAEDLPLEPALPLYLRRPEAEVNAENARAAAGE